MLKRLWPYLHSYKKQLVLSCLCVMGETVFELIIPVIMANIIDVGVANQDKRYILIKGSQMVVCALLSLTLGMFYARFAATAGQGFGAELRKEEFQNIQNFSFANTDHFSTSSLITRLTSDVNILQTAVSNGVRPLVRAPVMLICALIFTFTINAKLALVFIIAIPLLGLGLFVIVHRVGPLYRRMQSSIDQVNTIVQENLNAIRVVKSYVRGTHEKHKFETVNENLRSASEAAFCTSVWNMPLFQIVMYATITCIIWFGGNMIFAGEMKVGELTGFLSYVLQILNSLMMISNVFLMLTRSLASCERIIAVLDEKPGLDTQGGADAYVKDGSIDFDHVYFKYTQDSGEYVLSDINLKIKPGSTIGILGGTGAAKTTLVQLVPRLYDVSSGEIRIDGRNVREYPLRHLRNAVGMVLQKNTLFSGTIRENLLWGDENAGQEDIDWACRIAGADEFIKSFPEGYETDLGQGGVNVSGGQKQRLCIARALLKHPRVLIFDDSTSAVDTATEAGIREGLASLGNTTKIIIAQRISSVMHADQIVILEDGRLHAVGTHEELLAHNPIYQDIYTSQLEGAGL